MPGGMEAEQISKFEALEKAISSVQLFYDGAMEAKSSAVDAAAADVMSAAAMFGADEETAARDYARCVKKGDDTLAILEAQSAVFSECFISPGADEKEGYKRNCELLEEATNSE